MKRIVTVILAAAFAVAMLASCGSSLSMATGGNTGTYYAFGTALSQVLDSKLGINFKVEATGASKANIQLVSSGEADIAIVQNDVLDYAYYGTDLFNGEKLGGFSAVAAIYPEVCQIIANPDAGILTIADLKGKKVSVGDAGSGVEFNAKQILEAYGVTFDDISKQNLSFSASADAFKDGKIDAFFCTAGAPTSAVVDLALSNKIILLEIDDTHAEQLMDDHPFYTRYPIAAGSYNGVSEDVMTVAVKATIIVSNQLSEDTVYKITKALFDYKADIAAAHPKGEFIDAEYAVTGISVPFHPGAEKYFKEIGAIG